MSKFESEINFQPQALRELVDSDAPVRAAEGLRERNVPAVLTVARGSSGNAVTFFRYLLGRYLGIPAAAVEPSLLTVYDAPFKAAGFAALAVSQSGRSEDVRITFEKLAGTAALSLSVTNDEASPMAGIADVHLFQGVGKEEAVAATKTFTSQMMLLALVVAHWSGDEELLEALRAVPGAMQQLLGEQEEINAASLRLAHAKQLYVLGRGLSLAAAQEAALKLKETTYKGTQAYSSAEFQHGPFAALDHRSPVILMGLSDATRSSNEQLLTRLTEIGADVTVVSADRDLLEMGRTRVPLPSGLHPATEAFLHVLVGQLMSLHLTSTLGLDPDQPRNLKKVTTTV